MASAALPVPIFGLELFLLQVAEQGEGPQVFFANAASAVITVVESLLCIIIFCVLRAYAEQKVAFYGASGVIKLIIWAEVFFAATAAIRLVIAGEPSVPTVLSTFVFWAYCVMRIVAGIKMLSMPDNLGGLLRPYCITEIVFGLCCATLVLAPVGIMACMVSDIVLAVVFFRAADEMAT